jgi:hypothetical protein
VTNEQLKAEIGVEFEALHQIVNELGALRTDLLEREPTVRERTAAAAFLAQFYTGIENILKRLSRFYGIELPVGENWHLDLFKSFCAPARPPLPTLFDDALANQLAPFRRFRHVVHHGYGFQIEWERMRSGVEQCGAVFAVLRDRLEEHLQTI